MSELDLAIMRCIAFWAMVMLSFAQDVGTLKRLYSHLYKFFLIDPESELLLPSEVREIYLQESLSARHFRVPEVLIQDLFNKTL